MKKKLKYGNIELDLKFKPPTIEVYEKWKREFFSIEESKKFDIYLVGGFLDKMNGKKKYTPDVDIILVGKEDVDDIEKLVYEGTRIGLEKYQVFFDIFWLDRLPDYTNSDVVKINGYLLSNKWIINGEIKKEFKAARQVRENLWNHQMTFPSYKQKKLMKEGFEYSKPIIINI